MEVSLLKKILKGIMTTLQGWIIIGLMVVIMLVEFTILDNQ